MPFGGHHVFSWIVGAFLFNVIGHHPRSLTQVQLCKRIAFSKASWACRGGAIRGNGSLGGNRRRVPGGAVAPRTRVAHGLVAHGLVAATENMGLVAVPGPIAPSDQGNKHIKSTPASLMIWPSFGRIVSFTGTS